MRTGRKSAVFQIYPNLRNTADTVIIFICEENFHPPYALGERHCNMEILESSRKNYTTHK
ncbi:MAG: hypothetical protein HDR71_08490 [Lachnospiraceae bacterium]|nr:hypothetical protein [Lachnospiraceae bacterium]